MSWAPCREAGIPQGIATHSLKTSALRGWVGAKEKGGPAGQHLDKDHEVLEFHFLQKLKT